MNTIPLRPCQTQPNSSRIFDTTIPPIQRLRVMDDREFEDIVAFWASDYLIEKYDSVCEIGGSRDSGRDIIGYIKGSNRSRFDLYQCKQYSTPLSPSLYYIEFGKLCYYTYIGEYSVPQNYYIVASNGIGNDLRILIENPKHINQKLIDNWAAYCAGRNKIIASGLPLDDALQEYIAKFDFSIVKDVSPIRLLQEFAETKWYKYYFGGGLKPRPNTPKPSADVNKDEERIPYVSQLFDVYSDEEKARFSTYADISAYKKYSKHLQEQRHYFYSAQSLQRFARDELIDDSAYEQVKNEVEYGIRTVLNTQHDSQLKRVDATIDKARLLPIVSEELREIRTLDKCGICHELVNDGEISWNENNHPDD